MRSSAIAVGVIAVLAGGPFAVAVCAAGQATSQPQTVGTLKGQAKDAKGQKMANAKVRVRDVATGAIAAEILSDASGGFVVAGLAPATYVVEVVGLTGQVVGLSAATAVVAGTTATVAVTATAAGTIAAAAAGGGLSVLGLGTAASVAVASAAAAAGVVGLVATASTASPSR